MTVRAALALAGILIAATPSLAQAQRKAARPAKPTPPPGSHPAWGRTFASNYGPITVRAFDQTRFAATYTYHNGRADGDARGDQVTGYWTQAEGGHPCPTTRDGRKDWGRFTMTFSPDGRSFKGFTGYCDDTPDQPWDSK